MTYIEIMTRMAEAEQYATQKSTDAVNARAELIRIKNSQNTISRSKSRQPWKKRPRLRP